MMYKILENLATDGLGEPTELSSYVDCEIGLIDDFRMIDMSGGRLKGLSASGKVMSYLIIPNRQSDNPKYLKGEMDWESGTPISGKILWCCEDDMKMSRDNDSFYFKDEHYPEDNGFYEL